MSAPIFESSTSSLYYSNDARLHLVIDREHDKGIALSRTAYSIVVVDDKPVVDHDENGNPVGREVFRTFDRVKADAYIAGYDLARELA